MNITGNDWIAVLPALALVAGAMAAAVLGRGRRRDASAPEPMSLPLEGVACAALGISLAIVVLRLRRGMPAVEGFGRAVGLDDFSLLLSLAILSATALMILLSADYVKERGIPAGEYVALALLAAAGMVLLVQSLDLATFFVSLEVLSLCVYALAGILRGEPRSNEAAIKYFVTGAFASGFLLYGMALLYGATGSLSIREIGATLQASPPGLLSPATLGMALVAVGLSFKVGAVPFHMWVPDVYEGAPAPVTAFMSVAVKASAFGGFLRLLLAAGPAQPVWGELLAGVALATMIAGNLLALWQRSVKRMLAYSSVAHAGYVLVALASLPGGADRVQPAASALFYLFAYTFMTLGAFAFLVWMGREGKEAEDVDSFAGLARRRPWAAAAMTLLLVSLGGIPPTAGFFAKFWVFKAAIGAGQYLLVVAGVATTALSLCYYLRVVVSMLMKPPGEGAGERVSANAGFVVSIAAAATLLLGLWPSRFLDLSIRSIERLLR